MKNNQQPQLTFSQRKKILINQLKPLIGQYIYCPALKQNVYITKKSINETAQHAIKSTNSTQAALNITLCIQNAQLIYCRDPKPNNQTKTFHFKKIYILHHYLPHIGNIKIVVGQKTNLQILHYSITAY